MDWFKCGQCSPCISTDAVCCHDRPEVMDSMGFDKRCITDEMFFKTHLLSEEGLQYNRLILASMIKNNASRQKYLDREFDNTLRRHLCYRNFLVFVNKGQPLGKNNRVVLPQCVVEKIRNKYPDPDGIYTGFCDAAENLI